MHFSRFWSAICAAIFIQAGLAAAADLPPKILYHFGSQKYLLQYAALDTVPANIWNGRIMGEGGGYNLLPFRRGLYGATHPAFSDYFGDLSIGRGSTPWFIAIHVRQECRRPEHVADVQALTRDRRFHVWMKTARNVAFRDVASFAKECRRLNDVGGGDDRGLPCERTVDRFLREAGIRIVLDMAWRNSWYIRDRNCIERIEGTSSELLELMAHLPGYWKTYPVPGQYRSSWVQPRFATATFLIFLKALEEAGRVYPQTLASLRGALELADVSDARDPLWVKGHALLVLDSFERCATLGRSGLFQSVVMNFLAFARSPQGVNQTRFGEELAHLQTALQGSCGQHLLDAINDADDASADDASDDASDDVSDP